MNTAAPTMHYSTSAKWSGLKRVTFILGSALLLWAAILGGFNLVFG